MEDSLAFSQELPRPYRYRLSRDRAINSPRVHTDSTPLLESTIGDTIREDDESGVSPRKLKPMVYGIFATSAISSFLWGYNLSVISGAMLLITERFHLDVLWQGIIVSIMIGGATVGAASAGMLSDWIGRWKVLVMAALLLIAGALVMGLAPTKECLAAGRAVSGIGVGFITVVSPVYVAELMPCHIRGKLVFLSLVLTGFGVLGGAVVGGVFSVNLHFGDIYGWRCILGFAIIPASLMLIGLLFTPETPRWLVFHNKVEKARKVLLKVRHVTEVEDELNIITVARDESTQGDSVNVFQFFKRMCGNKAVLYAFIVGCSLHTLRSLGGPIIILNYSATIFNMAGFNRTKSIWFAVIPAFINLLGKVIGSLLLGRMGRRKLYLLSSLGATIFLLALAAIFLVIDKKSSPAVPAARGPCDYDTCGSCVADSHCGFCMAMVDGEVINGTCSKGNSHNDIYTKNGCKVKYDISTSNKSDSTAQWHFSSCPDNTIAPIAIAATCLYVIFFGIGLAPIPWIIISEIYPTWARGNGVAIGSMCNWIFALLVALTFLPLVDMIGQTLVFSIYAIFVFLGFVFVLFLVPDTKGKDLEETEKLFTKLYFLTWCT